MVALGRTITREQAIELFPPPKQEPLDLASVVGKWPGDETDSELRQALDKDRAGLDNPARQSLDLEAIEARCNAATPGPWVHGRNFWQVTVRDQLLAQLCEIELSPGLFQAPSMMGNDATFIANARTDIPALLQAVREREAEIGRLRELLTLWLDPNNRRARLDDDTRRALRGER